MEAWVRCRESILLFRQCRGRLARGRERRSLRVLLPCRYGEAIQQWQRRLADPVCVLLKGSSCSTAWGKPPRSQRCWVEPAIRQRARSAREYQDAGADSAAREGPRGWILPPSREHQNEKPIWPCGRAVQ